MIKIIEMENVKDIPGFEGLYTVDDAGNITGIKKGKVLKPIKNSSGYLYAVLRINGKQKILAVHRIVAMCFVENPNGLPIVNHLDGNKTNNAATNLEWTTHKSNSGHYTKNNGIIFPKKSKAQQNWTKTPKPVLVIYPDGTEKRFESRMEVQRQLGVHCSKVQEAIRNNWKPKGFVFKEAH